MSNISTELIRPELSDEGLGASIEVVAYDEFGQAREGHIAAAAPPLRQLLLQTGSASRCNT